MAMTLGSLFDGIGGWPDAAIRAGVKPLWASEIEPFPAAVTAYHYPGMKQLGDITKIDVDELEPVDIICAGSPCQDLSVAGKRKGLAGERSGLFRTAIDIVHRLRERTGKPRFFVWENVPGAFSSNGGADFRAVLEEIGQAEIPIPERNKWAQSGVVQCDECEIAWRVLDAQYWGVPQRRKRIFLVADFDGRSAAEILFIEQGLHGDSAESKGEGEEVATDVKTSIDSAVLRMRSECTGGGKGPLVSNEKSLTLATSNDQTLFTKITCYNVAQPSNNFEPYTKGGGVSPTLISRMGTGGNQVPIIHKAIGFYPQMKAESMAPMMEKSPCLINGTNPGSRNGVYFREGSFRQFVQDEKCGTLKASGGVLGGGSETFVSVNKTVRRLTPTECERLQGLPDGYTDIEFNGKPAPDSKRYKALGNGMAQPCARFVIRRIAETANK